jgi:VanZ family protein
MLSPKISGAISDAVANFLSDIFVFDRNGSAEGNGNFGIRKVAHFVEFFLLATVSVLFVRRFDILPARMVLILLSGGAFVSIVDETIQIFSSRGPSVRDVLIDMLGYVCGCVVAFLVVKTVVKFAQNIEKRTK